MSTPRYEHTQVGFVHWLLAAPAAALLLAGLLGDSPAREALTASGLAVVGVAACFRSLTVRDEGERLAIRYGPIPLFRKHVRYDALTGAEATRSTLIDGWGIHWIPGRGWIFNLWGWDCVRIELGTASIRVGTDDPEGLVAFLRDEIAARPRSTS